MTFRSSLTALVVVAACGDNTPGVDPRFVELAVAMTSDLETSTATAASVAVWIDGEVIWVGGFGDRDPDHPGTAPDEDTVFDIGSDTKKLTAISLLRQVAAGRLTLDDTVEQRLPRLQMQLAPEFGRTTVRQLLSHQSGIMDGAELTTSTTDAALADYAYTEFAATYVSRVPPGRFYNYSNPSFSIAGLLDQELSGRPWADGIEHDVFAPLGMTRTVARRSEVDDNRAEGFGYPPGGAGDGPPQRIALADNWESAFTRPAGLVWSTPTDQMRVAQFLVDGDPAILPSSLQREISTPQVSMYPDLPGAYGFGLVVARGVAIGEDWYDVPMWTHGGNTPSFTSTFVVLPEQRFAISILSNGSEDDFSTSVATAVATLTDLPRPSVAPARPFDPDMLDALAGTYVETVEGEEVTVTREGDALALSIPSFDAAGIPYERLMQHASTLVWIATIAGTPTDLSFVDTEDGMYLRNRELVLRRR